MARILIVDDEESDRLFERSILSDAGHALYFAPDGEVALEVYRERAVDLVITDLHMPHVNGLRLIRELREMHPEAVVIAISGVSADQLDLAADMGAIRTLYKPVLPALLLKAVDEALAEADEDDPWGRPTDL
jgi:two-component system, chemotaxis family, chemotaxis protein CheY